MLCQYGANTNFIDVTMKVQHFFQQDNRIVLPAGPKLFNEYFTDPIEGVVKQLIIYLPDNRMIIINENDDVAHDYEIYPEDLQILNRMRNL